MEMELQGLIDKIKKEGIEEAGKQSKDIVTQAEDKAKEIIADANQKSQNLINDAQKESDKLKEQTEESVRQAIRDSLLMLKQKITELFDTVIKEKVSEAMSPSALQGLIVKVIENFKKDSDLDIEILLKEKDKAALEKTVLAALDAKMRKGVTFKVSSTIENGFRIGEKGQNYYYDFTDEALAETLKVYLNPKLTKILDKSK